MIPFSRALIATVTAVVAEYIASQNQRSTSTNANPTLERLVLNRVDFHNWPRLLI